MVTVADTWQERAEEVAMEPPVRSCADGHRDLGECVRRWATRQDDRGLCECEEQQDQQRAAFYPADTDGIASELRRRSLESASLNHPWAPGEFSGRCQVMLARYRCPYPEYAHRDYPPVQHGGDA